MCPFDNTGIWLSWFTFLLCIFGYVSGKLKCWLSLWFQRCLIGNYIFQDALPAIPVKFLSIFLNQLRFIYFSSSLRHKHHDDPLVIQINLRFISMSSTVRQNNTNFLNGDYDQQNKRTFFRKWLDPTSLQITAMCFLTCRFWIMCECADSRIQHDNFVSFYCLPYYILLAICGQD